MTDEQESDLQKFLEALDCIDWLLHAGEAHTEWIVVHDAVEGFDSWGTAMMETWSSRTHILEQQAVHALGGRSVTRIFDAAAERVGPSAEAALEAYFERRPSVNENTACNADLGLWPEILDVIKRDVAWAGIEHILREPGFFANLMTYYRAGRWPCSWSGAYPDGRVVVL